MTNEHKDVERRREIGNTISEYLFLEGYVGVDKKDSPEFEKRAIIAGAGRLIANKLRELEDAAGVEEIERVRVLDEEIEAIIPDYRDGPVTQADINKMLPTGEELEQLLEGATKARMDSILLDFEGEQHVLTSTPTLGLEAAVRGILPLAFPVDTDDLIHHILAAVQPFCIDSYDDRMKKLNWYIGELEAGCLQWKDDNDILKKRIGELEKKVGQRTMIASCELFDEQQTRIEELEEELAPLKANAVQKAKMMEGLKQDMMNRPPYKEDDPQ